MIRWTVLSLLAGISFVLAARRPGKGVCNALLPCERCGRIADCQLPAAAQWKDATQVGRPS